MAQVTPYDFTVPARGGDVGRCRVLEIDYQRNGVAGNPFFVVRFQCSDAPERPLIGLVFDFDPGEETQLAYPSYGVIDPYDLTSHWRGDYFHAGLCDAITARYDELRGGPLEGDVEIVLL